MIVGINCKQKHQLTVQQCLEFLLREENCPLSSSFFIKQIFEINKSFDDGTFLHREVTSGDGKIDFQIGKARQNALITPPNNDPGKGDLEYSEVSEDTIYVKEWYQTYKISEFFYREAFKH